MPAFLHIYGHLEIELASAVTSHCREIVDDLEHEKDVLSQEKHALLHEKDILLQEKGALVTKHKIEVAVTVIKSSSMVIPLWCSNQTKRGTNTPRKKKFRPSRRKWYTIFPREYARIEVRPTQSRSSRYLAQIQHGLFMV
jgi:hypothetical protein